MSARHLAVGLSTVAIVAAVAGCSSNSSGGGNAATLPPSPASTTPTTTASPTPSTSASPTASATATVTAAACTSAHLQLSLGIEQGAAGSSYQVLVFTNTGGQACSLFGRPGVSFVDNSGTQVGPAASPGPGRLHTVVLAAGGKASATLREPDPGVFPASRCHATTATQLRVYPPNQRAALLIADQQKVCTTKAGGTSVTPVQSGTDANG